MKLLTFDPDATPKCLRHFELINVAMHSQTYQFANREELRNHGKLLAAIEAISTQSLETAGGRKLNPGVQALIVDDAWLELLKKMGQPASQGNPSGTVCLATASRDASAMLYFLDTAQPYVAPKVS